MNVLEAICRDKKQHIQAQKRNIPESEVRARSVQQSPARGFARALTRRFETETVGMIAEIKKASPSRGVIREDFDPAALAQSYEKGGAACISVLTDVPYFQGKDQDLIDARAAVALPVLRKDFMLDPYQVVESRALGADCILLIMAALSAAQAQELEAAATDYGMDVLVEVHDERELERALRLKSSLVGINNRDLKTLKVDLATSERVIKEIPSGYIVVCESGIETRADIARMQACGIHCFLVGESLMKQGDVEKATRDLLGARD